MEEPGGMKRKREEEEAGASKRTRGEELATETWESLVKHMRDKLYLPRGPARAEDIPDDVIISIFLMLPSKYHRHRMSLSCRAWRRAYARFSFLIPKELAWLLMPSTTRPLVHVTAEAMTYNHTLAPEITQDARFCGSVEGGCVVVALDNTRDHLLYNLSSRRTSQLPRTLLFQDGQVREIRVEAAIPFGWPNQDRRCVVAAIVREINGARPSEMAYWQPDLQHWVHAVSARYSKRQISMLDVLYHSHRHAFLYLSEDLSVHVLRLVFDGNGRFVIDYDKLQVTNDWHNIKLMDAEAISRLQYLVQAGDDILRIVKNLDDNDRTRSLIIFKLEIEFSSGSDEEELETEDGAEASKGKIKAAPAEVKEKRSVYWSRPQQLPGRVVFAGRGSSRVFETDSLADYILFHEERPDPEAEIPLPQLYDRTDMGMFSVQVAAVRAWPPAGGEAIAPATDICPSIWWFH